MVNVPHIWHEQYLFRSTESEESEEMTCLDMNITG
jgi:hypothetical protein